LFNHVKKELETVELPEKIGTELKEISEDYVILKNDFSRTKKENEFLGSELEKIKRLTDDNLE
jgi:hypothetical protein